MELLKEVRKRYECNNFKNYDLLKGIHNALSKIDSNLDYFTNLFPRPSSLNYVYPGILNGGEIDDWTSGFWTGILWLAYEFTKDDKYKNVANYQLKSFDERIDNKIGVNHHDLGFLYTPSVVSNYKITNNEQAKNTAIKAAEHLLSRYQEKGEFIQAWGDLGVEDNYRLIIDCNLNVPLLFWAYEVTKNEKFKYVAKKHLETVSKVILRDNGSTFHTYYFDKNTGLPKYGKTAQGKSDDSTWARGQAWGVYGFALSYKYLRDKKYIDLYKKVLNVFLNKLPEDNVCYWDLDFKKEDLEERDTSAMVIMVCGILEMNKYLSNDDEDKIIYYNAAMNILKSLIENYTTKDLKNSNGLLKEAVYSKPHKNGVNECCIWGDYFYMEALMRVYNPSWEIYW